MYALKTKGKYQFYCISKTAEELEEATKIAFDNWRGMQASGSNKTIKDFMETNEMVKVTIERI
jgi:hypothetical protein